MQPTPTNTLYLPAMRNAAMALHQKGQLQQAKVGYEALHLLGLVAVQTGKFAEAVDLIGKAKDIFPHDADFFANRGLAQQQLQQREAALASYDQAIALNPGVAEFHFFRGNVLQAMQRHDAAIASFGQATTLRPDHAQACFNRGFSQQALHQWEDALTRYDKAISIHPGYAEAHCNRAAVLLELKRLDEVVAACDKALALEPDYAEALTNRGVALYGQHRYSEAIASYDAAIRLKPDYLKAHTNRGVVLHGLKQWDAALASYDKATTLLPSYAQAHASRGLTLHACGRWDAALVSFEKAITLDADDAQSYFNKSMTLLLRGDFAAGLPLYEWRWETEKSKLRKRSFTQLLWLGAESVEGKTILLHCEQGYGDTIQFVRHAKLLAARGARVVLEAPQALVGLLQGLEGVHTLVTIGAPLPPFDMHCPLLSLPLAFKTELRSIPATDAYLLSDAGKVERWSTRLGPRGKPRVGLVWSGNAEHANDSNRSIALANLLPYLPEACEYVSLHKELRDADRSSLVAHGGIRHFGEQLQDFRDTAALVTLMERVISVDPNTAHLSAALGKPTAIPLPLVPDCQAVQAKYRWRLDARLPTSSNRAVSSLRHHLRLQTRPIPCGPPFN